MLGKVLIARVSPAVSIKDMATTADLPWVEQGLVIFEATNLISHRTRCLPALSSGDEESQPTKVA